jgi:hypothetical protein
MKTITKLRNAPVDPANPRSRLPMTVEVSFLSPYVKRLLNSVNSAYSGAALGRPEGEVWLLDVRGLPVFRPGLLGRLPDETGATPDERFYLDASVTLAEAFSQCLATLWSLESDGLLRELAGEASRWVSCPDFFAGRCWTRVALLLLVAFTSPPFSDVAAGFASGNVTPYETALYLTPLLESSLADLLATTLPAAPRPRLTKDLVGPSFLNCPSTSRSFCFC